MSDFNNGVWWDIYQLLNDASGTDKYYCPEYVENALLETCPRISDIELRSTIGKFYNEKRRWPEVSVKDEALQSRFDRLIPERKIYTTRPKL